MKRKETHVVPNSRGGWDVVRPGAATRESGHANKRAAEQRARELTREIGGGEVVVHGRDGRIQDADTIKPSNGDGRKRTRVS
jgi:Uncharacterized protein conserved in bacteria (DUF2188)